MAGKIDITLPEAEQAVKTFCEIYDSCSFVKPGPDLFEITVTDGEKAVVSLINGSLECQRRPELKDKLLGLIMDAREGSPRTPINSTSLPGKAIMPKPARNGSNGALVKPGAAIRDVQVADLTAQDIKDFICPDANDQEAYMFLKLCQARNLNPFTREAYLVKYGGKSNMIVGKEAFTRKAEMHPQFDGFRAGIVLETGEEKEGALLFKADVLVGGWAEVYRKDRKVPFKAVVSLKEFSKGQATWKDMPATMIRKVALVSALREAFPSDLSGCYDSSEMGINPENEVLEAV